MRIPGALALLAAAAVALPLNLIAADDEEIAGTYEVTNLTAQAAAVAAQAAHENCRESGSLVSVAVVDRHGLILALVRDNLAGPFTPKIAEDKARTAINFRSSTANLVAPTEQGRPEAAIRLVDGAMIIPGGLIIDAGGTMVGGIGVSGAPSGELDEQCATAGIEAIEEYIAF